MEETEYSFLRSRDLSVVLTDDKGIIGFPRISTKITVDNPIRFEQLAEIELKVIATDGKQIIYDFLITNDSSTVAKGTFRVACCRFPTDNLPYAILTPEFVLKKLALH